MPCDNSGQSRVLQVFPCHFSGHGIVTSLPGRYTRRSPPRHEKIPPHAVGRDCSSLPGTSPGDQLLDQGNNGVDEGGDAGGEKVNDGGNESKHGSS